MRLDLNETGFPCVLDKSDSRVAIELALNVCAVRFSSPQADVTQLGDVGSVRQTGARDEWHTGAALEKLSHPVDRNSTRHELRSRLIGASPFPDRLAGFGLVLHESESRVSGARDHDFVVEHFVE
jgi:hypothetical protein